MQGPHDTSHLGHAVEHPGVEVRARADLEHRAALAEHVEHGRVLDAADAVTDAVGLERLDCLAHLGGAAGLASVHGKAEPGSAALVEDVGVVREPKAIGHRPGDVDADHPPAVPADRLGRDDLVQRRREGSIEAEDQPGADLRVLEDGAIHAAHRRGDDVVEILLAATVALHRVEAQLEAGHVVLAVRAADDLVDAALDRDRARLDQLGPVEEVEVRLEAAPPATDRDEVAERPVVLGRQPDALGVRDAPHDCRRDRGAEMDVQLGQWQRGGRGADEASNGS